jgi:hypothetical protein
MAVARVTEEHIHKVKEYAERLNLRRLMFLQQELMEKRKWLEGYDAEPNPYLEQAAVKMRETLKNLERETDMQFSKLSTETQRMINRS